MNQSRSPVKCEIMPLLETAERLAAERGYFQDPVVLALLPQVPTWFRALGSPTGQAAFEETRGFALPLALREFYERLSLACFVHAAIDGHIFSAGMCDNEPAPPPVVRWASGIHVVLAYHPHSASVCGAAINVEDPLVAWGFEDEPDCDQPVGHFSTWVHRIIEDYERTLDRLQAHYASRDPGLLENVDWISKWPGMKARLAR